MSSAAIFVLALLKVKSLPVGTEFSLITLQFHKIRAQNKHEHLPYMITSPVPLNTIRTRSCIHGHMCYYD